MQPSAVDDLDTAILKRTRVQSYCDDHDDFIRSAFAFLDANRYFVTATNSDNIKRFYTRIFKAFYHSDSMRHNRICALLTGYKDCGKTTLIRLTCEFLSIRSNTMCVYLKCTENRKELISPLELIINTGRKIGYIPKDVVFTTMYELLEWLSDNRITPFVFYDDAEYIWATSGEDYHHCCTVIDQLYTIANHGYAFASLSGSWKLEHLAHKTSILCDSFKTIYPRYIEYKNLCNEKYHYLQLFPISNHDEMYAYYTYYRAYTGDMRAMDMATLHRIHAITGGRFDHIHTLFATRSVTTSCCDAHAANGIEIKLLQAFVDVNWAKLTTAYTPSTHSNSDLQSKWEYELISYESLTPLSGHYISELLRTYGNTGSNKGGELIDTMDYVDRSVLVPCIDYPHLYLPAYIILVCNMYERLLSYNLDRELLYALRFPEGRRHAEYLQWYCHTTDMPHTIHKDYLSLTRPPPVEPGVVVYDLSSDIVTVEMLWQWARDRRRLKPLRNLVRVIIMTFAFVFRQLDCCAHKRNV